MEKPQYFKVVDALIGMACQYLEGRDSKLDDGLVSAGESCIAILDSLGLIKDGEIVPQAFDIDWLKKYLG